MYWGLGAPDLGPHLGEIGRTCPFAPRSARSVTALGVRGPPDVQPRRLQFETREGLSSGKSVCRAAGRQQGSGRFRAGNTREEKTGRTARFCVLGPKGTSWSPRAPDGVRGAPHPRWSRPPRSAVAGARVPVEGLGEDSNVTREFRAGLWHPASLPPPPPPEARAPAAAGWGRPPVPE